jgi:hypothetical protein
MRTNEFAKKPGERHRVAGGHQVTSARDGEQPRAGNALHDRFGLCERNVPVLVALDHERRAANRSSRFPHVVAQPSVASHRSGVAIGRAAAAQDPVFVGLGRMRLGEDVTEEGVKKGRPGGAHLHDAVLRRLERRRLA